MLAIYSRDVRTLEAYLNSFLEKPYNLTVFLPDGRVYLTVGPPVIGVAAVAKLLGWNGSLKPLIVSYYISSVCYIIELDYTSLEKLKALD